MNGTHTSIMPTGAPPTCASWQSKHPEHTDAQRHSVCRKARLQMAWAAEALPDGTPSAKGNTLMCHQGVDVQCKCTLIICYSTRIRYFDDTRDCAIGGLSAARYFFTVSMCMPSSRAIPRMDRYLCFAFCTLPIWPPVAASAFCAAEPQLCEVFQCHSRRTCQGSFRHRVWRPSL